MGLKSAMVFMGMLTLLSAPGWSQSLFWSNADLLNSLDQPPKIPGSCVQCNLTFHTWANQNEVTLHADASRINPGENLWDFFGTLYQSPMGWALVSDRGCQHFVMSGVQRFSGQTWFLPGQAVRVRARYDLDAPAALHEAGTPILVTDIMPIW